MDFAQLFSFRVLYDKEGGGLSGKTWRRAVFEVDFSARMVRLQEKEQTIESQPFSAYDKYFGADPGTPLVSISFEGDLWQLFTQNAAEKSCIEHLLQCVRKEISAEEAIRLGHGIIGLDRRIMKYGFILRKATTRSKKDKRFLVLVPGKLFMFKGKDITNRHARYVTSLLGATVRVVDSLLEFQLFSPNSREITFIASDAEDLASWLELLEESIECADCGKCYSIMPDTATNCLKAGTDSPFSSRSKEDQFRQLQLVGREDYTGDKCKKKQEKTGVEDVHGSINSKDAEAEGGRHRFSQGKSRERKLSHRESYDFYNPSDDEEKEIMDAFYLGRNERRRKERRHRLGVRRAEAYAYYGGSIETRNGACEAVPKRHRIRPNLADEAQYDFYEEQYGESYVDGRRHRGNTREFAEERDGWTSAPVGSVAYYRSSYRENRSGGMRQMNEPDINETSIKQRDQGRRLVRYSGNEEGGVLQDESAPPVYKDDHKSETRFVEDGFVSAARMRKKSSFDGLSRYMTERHKYSRLEVPPSEFSRRHHNLSQDEIARQRMVSQMEEKLSALDWSNKRDDYGSGYDTRKQAKHFEQGLSFVEGILVGEPSAVDLARRASRRFYI